MDEATIRTARTGDEARCLELLGILRRGDVHPGAGEIFRQLLDGARGQVLVAEDAETGEILGSASVTYNPAMRYGGEYCQLEELIVDPVARGRNIGALLVNATIEAASSRGCREYGLYLLEHTKHNLKFYERFGLERIGDELRMRLP